MRDGVATFLQGVEMATGVSRRETRGVPGRVARAWRDELLAGHKQDPSRILRPLRSRSSEDLVAARDLAFTSICRHHLLPFHGHVHLAYLPAGRITGFSRLSRLVDCLSRRLQLQELLTRQIADALQAGLQPAGAACVIEATHTCMTLGWIPSARGRIVTAAFTGSLRRNSAKRREVLGALGYRGAPGGGSGHSRG